MGKGGVEESRREKTIKEKGEKRRVRYEENTQRVENLQGSDVKGEPEEIK